MAKNRVLIFGKIMVQVRVFVGEKSIGTRFKTRRGARACLKLVMVWVLDEY